MTGKEVKQTNARISKLRALKNQRKAIREAKKAGSDEVAMAALQIEEMELEEWFGENCPELDVHSDKAINAALRRAKDELKIAETLADDSRKARKGRRTPVDVEMPAKQPDVVMTKSRKEAATVRRAPARMRRVKAH